jgi:LysR family hydrogen peroxide-inducible transcriptional activator
MANFTLKQLRYFEALAAHRHFGRAAEVCAISQPALSVQIRELEGQLGQPLFERGARQVRLTAFGETVAQRVSEILRASEALEDFARATRDRMVGRFRIGVIPTIAPYLLPRLIRRLGESHPGLDLQVRETLTPRLVEELHQGKLDCAILALPVSEPAFTEVPLFTEAFLLVRPESARDLPPPSAADLQEMKLLLLEEGHCFRDQALDFCNSAGKGPQAGLDGSSLSTLVQMVGSGIGVTMIPEMAVPVETRSAPVTCSRFEGGGPGRTVGMIWRRSTPFAEELAEIAEAVRASAAPAAAPLSGP